MLKQKIDVKILLFTASSQKPLCNMRLKNFPKCRSTLIYNILYIMGFIVSVTCPMAHETDNNGFGRNDQKLLASVSNKPGSNESPVHRRTHIIIDEIRDQTIRTNFIKWFDAQFFTQLKLLKFSRFGLQVFKYRDSGWWGSLIVRWALLSRIVCGWRDSRKFVFDKNQRIKL